MTEFESEVRSRVDRADHAVEHPSRTITYLPRLVSHFRDPERGAGMGTHPSFTLAQPPLLDKPVLARDVSCEESQFSVPMQREKRLFLARLAKALLAFGSATHRIEVGRVRLRWPGPDSGPACLSVPHAVRTRS